MGSEMAYYHAAVESRRSATETVGYLAIFSNAADWDRGVLAGEQLDSGPAGADSPLPAGGAVPGGAHFPDLRGHQVRAGPGSAPARFQWRASSYGPDRSNGHGGRLDGQL
jgi:hypothetical protein